MKILKKQSKIRLKYPESLQKKAQNIRVGRVTGNKTFSFFGLMMILNKLTSQVSLILRNRVVLIFYSQLLTEKEKEITQVLEMKCKI